MDGISPPLPPPPGGSVAPPAAPDPAPPSRRRPAIVVAASLAVLLALGSIAFAAAHDGAATAASSPSEAPPSVEAATIPPTLDGQPRITSGPLLQRIRASTPTLPIGGASYDVALYGSKTSPASMLLVIHGLSATFDQIPANEFFQSVGDGLATGIANADTSGQTVDFSHGVQASVGGADHDCVPVEHAGKPDGVICLFRTSQVIGMVVLFQVSDAHAALAVSEEAAGKVG